MRGCASQATPAVRKQLIPGNSTFPIIYCTLRGMNSYHHQATVDHSLPRLLRLKYIILCASMDATLRVSITTLEQVKK